MNIDQSLFDKEEFRKWLEEKPDNSTVGHAKNGCHCPLAMWVRSKGLQPNIHADAAEIGDGSVPMFPAREYLVPLPWWAQNFIYSIDTAAEERAKEGTLNYSEVSREEALNALGGKS